MRRPARTAPSGMEMITDYVPGAYMTHDMLHMRGGHQTSWLIDGVAIPNTKIASNVGPQIDPKDIDSLETAARQLRRRPGRPHLRNVQRAAAQWIRVQPRTASCCSLAAISYTGEAQLAFGDHSEKTAWYASATGSRSNYGLATPVTAIYHDATNSRERVRVADPQPDAEGSTARGRADTGRITFRFPTIRTRTTTNATSDYYCSYGLRDGQTERDSFVIANWVHTISPKALFSVAPFYHFNQSDYDSRPTDYPVATTWHQDSNYVGAQADAQRRCGMEQLFRRAVLVLPEGETICSA